MSSANGNGTPKSPLVRNGSQATENGTSGKKIKAVVLTSTGSGSDYSNLKLKDEDYPTVEGVAGKEEFISVRVKAAGLNFAELMQRQGLYRPSNKCPYTPGFEAAGIVEQVGSAVTDFKVDDRVIVFNGSGMWKDVVTVTQKNAIKMPDNMSFEDGASFIVNYLTAYQVLFRMGNLKPNEVVLIHMAAGGVGTAAVQLCKTVPGVVVIGTASSAKHDAIRENGVTHAIDYSTSDYVQEVRKIYPDGVDLVLDPLNGENSIKGFGLLKPFGRIVHFGAASISSESRSLVNAFKAWWKCLTVNALDIMSENKSVSGYHLGYLLPNPVCREIVNTDVKILLDLYEKGVIKIKVDSIYSYAKIGEAMKRMHSRQNIGKILLKPDYEIAPPAAVEQVQIVTTVVSTPTANGSATKNGDLPNIKPLKVNGESTPAAEEVKTEEKKEEKLTNGDHHEEEKKAEDVSEEKTNGETEPVTNEINGKQNVEVVAAQEAEPTSA